MAATIISGTAIAASLREELAERVHGIVAEGNRPPCLMVLLVGDHPASASYVRAKGRAARAVGFSGETIHLPDDITQADLLAHIAGLNNDPLVDGILVQLPLPPQIDETAVIHAIDPRKDVDCFHPTNAGLLAAGTPYLAPCTPAGIIHMIRRSHIETVGKHAVILGRSNIVGRPMASLLLQRGIDATVTVCHSKSAQLTALCQSADILIAAIGRAEFVGSDMVKPGATVIDVGINRVDDSSRERGYRLVGDVAFEAVKEVAGYLTPVPGGVGPMTIATLLENTLHAYISR